MAYTHFSNSTPASTQTGPNCVDSMRENLLALRDAIVSGALKGWDMTPSGGTGEQPATITFDSSTERLRQSLTWGAAGGADGNVTKSIYCYSSDSGSSWDYIGTENITYDTDGNVTAITWTTGDSC